MFCQSCGQKMADDAKFCENCGALTQQPSTPPPPPRNTYQQPPYQQPPYQQPPYQQPPYQQTPPAYYPQPGYQPMKPKSGGKKVLSVIAIVVVILLVIIVAFSLLGKKDLSALQTAAAVNQTTFKAINPTSVFATDTPVIYCTFRSELPVGTLISAEWAYLGTDPDSVTIDYETKYSPEMNYFNMDIPEGGWPVGKYQIAFSIEGKPYQTVKFEVKGSTGKPTPTSKPSATSSMITKVQTALKINETTLEPVSPQSVFTKTAPMIYVTFMINNVKVGSLITVEWVYATTGESIISNDANTTESSQNASFNLSKPDADWPAGEYEVRISVDGTYVTSAKFAVKQVNIR